MVVAEDEVEVEVFVVEVAVPVLEVVGFVVVPVPVVEVVGLVVVPVALVDVTAPS